MISTDMSVRLKRRKIKKNSTLNYILKNKYLYILMLPGIILLIIFRYAPMYGVLLGFKDFDFSLGILRSPWNNFKHFKHLFSSPEFYQVFYNSITLSLMKIIFTFPIPIILAISLNEIRNIAFKRIIQTIIYLPHFISWVVLITITFNLLSSTDGLVNVLIKNMGHKPIMFFGNLKWFRPLVIFTSIWKEAGWNTIIYLAALTSIDRMLYESATIDGASRIRCIWHITLPCLAGTIVILLVLSVGRVMDNGFEQIFLLQNDVNRVISDVFETYTYRIGLVKGEFSYSTAVGFFKSIIGFLLIVTANKTAKLLGQESVY